MDTTRQTLTFLKERFAERGIRPKTQHGQNFLVDLNLMRLLAETAELSPHDVVLEVGCGTGSLTAMMAPLCAHVVAVDLDGHLLQLARETLIDAANVTFLHADALRNKNHLSDELIATLRERLGAAGDDGSARRLKLVANLPYHIATPVISNLLAGEPRPVSMTVTIQRELAERMAAVPSTKDYSALSIWVQSQCHVRIVRILPPTVFWPRPKVESAIVQITTDESLAGRIGDRAFFHEFVRTLFQQRRKHLRVTLARIVPGGKPEVDALLARLGWPTTVRAESLSVEELIRLAREVQAIPAARAIDEEGATA